jgi:starch synthase
MDNLNILFAASEVYPFAKSGGLADVAYSLPRALALHHNVTVVMPLYQFIDQEQFSIIPLDQTFEITMGIETYTIELYHSSYEGGDYLFISTPILCDKDFLYGPPEQGYEDNAIRFALFNYAIVALLQQKTYDIAHLNDWQCGLTPLLIKEMPTIKTKTLFTIHNLAYQGVFDKGMLYPLGIHYRHFTMEGIEFYDQISFMKAGIGYADALTTVSPTYVKEILIPEFGCGLEGYLKVHEAKLTGLINGIDREHFSPINDTFLYTPYLDLKGKGPNKRAVLKAFGLKGTKKPLFIFIGRFTWQKGLDLLIESLPQILALESNIIILGEGEKQYHKALDTIKQNHPNLHIEFGYEEALSHKLYAAADFLLMPSLFEPCGLNQMIAMGYGTIPIVHRVGGLSDTVHPIKNYKSKSVKGYGIVFKKPTKRALINAFKKALELYHTKSLHRSIALHNMEQDFSWTRRVIPYNTLYNDMLVD